MRLERENNERDAGTHDDTRFSGTVGPLLLDSAQLGIRMLFSLTRGLGVGMEWAGPTADDGGGSSGGPARPCPERNRVFEKFEPGFVESRPQYPYRLQLNVLPFRRCSDGSGVRKSSRTESLKEPHQYENLPRQENRELQDD